VIRIWIQREYICKYYCLLPHLTWSHVRIQPVIQCSAQYHINYDIRNCSRFLDIRDITKKKLKCFTTEHTLEELFVMVVPTFVDLQEFTIGRRFAVKAVLKKGTILSHYIFASPISWDLLTESEKFYASWLIHRLQILANHHRLQWKDGIVPQYGEMLD